MARMFSLWGPRGIVEARESLFTQMQYGDRHHIQACMHSFDKNSSRLMVQVGVEVLEASHE